MLSFTVYVYVLLYAINHVTVFSLVSLPALYLVFQKFKPLIAKDRSAWRSLVSILVTFDPQT